MPQTTLSLIDETKELAAEAFATNRDEQLASIEPMSNTVMNFAWLGAGKTDTEVEKTIDTSWYKNNKGETLYY